MKKTGRKIMAAVIGLSLLTGSVPVQVLAVNNGAAYPIATNERQEWPQGPQMYAETAVLIEAETGAVLFDKGMDEKRYPASITKIMTALVALEHADLKEEVVFTEACLEAQASDSTNIGMQVGEVLTMEQCLMALMIKSANDVANQIGEHVSGSVAAFAEEMNRRAAEIGCTNTNFVNPSGLPDENHYTTAHDMALIFREAIKNGVFKNIISTLSYTIEPTNKNPNSRNFSTHHALLAPSAPEHYEGCFGGKTGNTLASGNTLVSGAERNGMTLIAVAMRAEAGQVCQDQIQMFDYGFQNFKKVQVPGGSVILPIEKELEGLTIRETENETTVEQSYYYPGDHLVGCARQEKVISLMPEEVDEPEVKPDEKPEEAQKPSQPEKKQEVLILLCVLIGAGSLAIILNKKKKHKKRKKNK